MRPPEDFAKLCELAVKGNELVTTHEGEWPEFKDAVWRERAKLRIDSSLFTIFSFEFRADDRWHFRGIVNTRRDNLARLRH